MAVPYHHSSNNWMLPVKIALISTAVLCIALMLKLSAPVLTDFAFSDLPSVWTSLISWLKPPYLYVVINCIIVTLVATSKLQQNAAAKPPPQTVVHLSPPEKAFPDYAAAVFDNVVVKNDVPPEFPYSSDGLMSHPYEQSVPTVPEKEIAMIPSQVSYGYNATISENVPAYEQSPPPVPKPERKTPTKPAVREDLTVKDELAAVAASESFRTPLRSSREFPLPSIEKPPVSVRFSHRKPVKSSPEGGRTLGVAKPKKHDTLESTWKTITEGRPMPLNRHLKKSDTWEREGPHHLQAQSQRMTKSETFKERGATAKRPPVPSSNTPAEEPGRLRREVSGSMKMKKEPSLGQDELNRRVEAFINNFNEQMRLQRQESMNQYMEMINRGVHSSH